jgi:tRNA dimethylallyltransferase
VSDQSENGPTRRPLLVIVGPTAVGKTALSLRVAASHGGVIISADSRQIYRGMDIGTAKPTPTELSLAPHELIDIVDPDEPFGLAQFQKLAMDAITETHRRGLLPLLVGGTGQYVRAVVEGWGIPRVSPQLDLRGSLAQEAERDGAEALHRRLAEADPEAAARIDARNVRRVIRALEVYLVTGTPISELQRKTPPPFDILQVGLRRDREELYARIDARIEAMLAAGLLDEVRALRTAGYADDLPSMSGLGYRQFLPHLDGEESLSEAVDRVKKDTRRFVRQQSNWFREDDPRITWFDADDHEAIEGCVASWLM